MKIARGRELLTLEQRQDFMQIPEDEWILGTYFTFSKRDLEIVNKRRREENRLGFAVQLAVLRYPGWPYTHIKSIPESVIHYISKQIGATPSSISLYPQRENTLWDHLKELRSEYDFVTFTLREYRIAFKHLHQLAFENGDAIHLLHECIDFLRKNKIILPAITTLERMAWEARAMAEKKLFNTVSQSLTNEQKGKLEEIITSQHPPESNKTILGWLKEPPGHPSPETFLKVIERLEYIRGMELETVQISHLHRNRLFQLSRLGSRYEPYAFRDFQENKRYSILTVYLLHLTQELTDKDFEIHDRQILSLLSKGRKAQEEIQKQNGKKLNEKVIHFTNIGQALIKAKKEKLDVFEVLESVIEWNSFVSSVEEAQELARPADYDYLDLLQKRFYSLRKYTPTLLRVLEFHSTKANEPLIQAVEIIRGMNESGKRKVPDNSPLDFISKRWKKHLYEDDGTTSSSDGMRMQLGVSSLHTDANPHYGTGKGATIYRFTSDQFSSYYTKIIHTNSRDAIHVLDGLLHHETDLNIEEHYTDTAGYTDQIFGLTHLLGFKFAPRIRDLSDSKLFTIDKASEYPKLEAILRGQINTKVIKENYEDVLRLAHSIREGTVSASLIMGKLGSYSRQNSLATALREMGRIEKTIFILNYISDESLRRKIQRGLNKGEAMNGLARAIFFGKQGELRERTIQHQLQRASALNIIINAISIWNTLHLTKAVEYQKRSGRFNEELLHHMSPLGWEHINLLGEYHFNLEKVVSLDSLRPLKLS